MSSASNIHKNNLLFAIKQSRFIMLSPCSQCFSLDKTYLQSSHSSQCSKYVHAGHHCIHNNGSSTANWQKLFEAQDKLEYVKQETLSYLLHLQKQKKLLHNQTGKFLESESKSMEDLKHLKKKKQKRVAEQAEIQNLLASLNNFSFSGSLPVVSNSFINALLRVVSSSGISCPGPRFLSQFLS
ncbi:conserved hypothetical protein [Coccidioides posadasii str. Silveira]|uniref:Uncharacterized protein n=1 Tax=Coccidioides posadasii (strain RMSCC 757 / Silveira) TaxID=443226 RepID=E9DAS5_COCPS|nr:conserved hypothetical protein [Coccidioides posadasii str. Silveira]